MKTEYTTYSKFLSNPFDKWMYDSINDSLFNTYDSICFNHNDNVYEINEDQSIEAFKKLEIWIHDFTNGYDSSFISSITDRGWRRITLILFNGEKLEVNMISNTDIIINGTKLISFYKDSLLKELLHWIIDKT